MTAVDALTLRDALAPEFLAFQEGHALQAAEVAGQEWRYRRTAPGAPVLLLLPGALGTGDVFFRTALHFSGRFDAVTVTYPAVHDPAALSDGLAALLTRLGASRAVVVGSSLGGYLAQVLAARHPDRIALAVFGNTFRDPADQQAPWPAPDVFARKPAEVFLHEARARLEASAAGSARQAELRAILLSLVGTAQDAERAKAQRLTVLRATALQPLDLPPERIALIDDDDDPVITPGTREDMRRSYARSRHERIVGGGHYPSILAPEPYHAALDQLVATVAC
jgi:maspardin